MTQTQDIFRALAFAALKHRDLRRKGPIQAPYINHLIDVAERVAVVGGIEDAPTLIAALLHDTVEDTATSPEELGALFGEEVTAMVMELTDDKSLPKPERKKNQILNAPKKSRGAKAIKLADKTSNVREIAEDPPVGWDHARRAAYFDWAEQVVNALRGMHPALEASFDAELRKSRVALGSA